MSQHLRAKTRGTTLASCLPPCPQSKLPSLSTSSSSALVSLSPHRRLPPLLTLQRRHRSCDRPQAAPVRTQSHSDRQGRRSSRGQSVAHSSQFAPHPPNRDWVARISFPISQNFSANGASSGTSNDTHFPSEHTSSDHVSRRRLSVCTRQTRPSSRRRSRDRSYPLARRRPARVGRRLSHDTGRQPRTRLVTRSPSTAPRLVPNSIRRCNQGWCPFRVSPHRQLCSV